MTELLCSEGCAELDAVSKTVARAGRAVTGLPPMIHAVFARGARPYLAGVFSELSEEDDFLGKVPAALRDRLETVQRPDLDLPCFVIEAADELRLADRDELCRTLGRWRDERDASAEHPDHVFGNVYWLPEPWMPPEPGTDSMGIISHVHVERRHIDAFAEGGLRQYLSRWLRAEAVEAAMSGRPTG